MTDRTTRTGCYGFRLRLPAELGTPTDLVQVPADRPEVAVSLRRQAPLEDEESVGPDRIALRTTTGSGLVLTRDPLTLALELPTRPGGSSGTEVAALVHPTLTVPMSAIARWHGMLTLHAGAFEHAGRAWVVLGTRAAGKSSLLAGLGQRGVPVLTDDLVVVDGGMVWSGPACVDLRDDGDGRFTDLRDLGEVAGRRRRRLTTPAASTRLPLGGTLLLSWEPGEPVATALPRDQLIRLLWAQEYLALMGPQDPLAVLDLSALPAWHVSRPMDWRSSESALDLVLQLAQTG